MVLQRWYPVAEFRQMENIGNRFWRGFNGRTLAYKGVDNRILPLDVEEDDDNIVVRASLPGVSPEDIQVTTEDGVLTIEGGTSSDNEANEGSYLVRERRRGSFRRSIRLPDTVDADNADSSYEHGVLAISFPKQEAKKPRRLEVKVKS